MFKQIHHIAFAVYDLEGVVKKLEKEYNLIREKRVMIKDRDMEAILYKTGKTRLEFLSPISEESPLNKYLENNKEGFHHIAYLVDDINEAKKQLPEGSLEPIRKSSVGNWLIADLEDDYSLLNITSQLIQENK